MHPNETSQSSIDDKKLWLIFMLKNQLYAIDSICVESISKMEEEAIKLPRMDGAIVGILNMRGHIISLLDLRKFMGMVSLKQEQVEFEEMLELRGQDHIHWVDELKRCMQEDDEFTLATDPHQCKFGKWYDNYKAESHTVAFHLNKIDEPHKKLHATAEKAIACKHEHHKGERNECLQSLFQNETDVYMNKVIGLLEQTKQVFNENYRNMCVVLSSGKSRIAILVDSVVSVEPLCAFTKSERFKEETPIVSFLAQRNHSSEQVLILNHERFLGTE